MKEQSKVTTCRFCRFKLRWRRWCGGWLHFVCVQQHRHQR